MRSDYVCANCGEAKQNPSRLAVIGEFELDFCSPACFWKWAWVHAPSEVAKHSDTKKISLVDQTDKGSDFSLGSNES